MAPQEMAITPAVSPWISSLLLSESKSDRSAQVLGLNSFEVSWTIGGNVATRPPHRFSAQWNRSPQHYHSGAGMALHAGCWCGDFPCCTSAVIHQTRFGSIIGHGNDVVDDNDDIPSYGVTKQHRHYHGSPSAAKMICQCQTPPALQPAWRSVLVLDYMNAESWLSQSSFLHHTDVIKKVLGKLAAFALMGLTAKGASATHIHQNLEVIELSMDVGRAVFIDKPALNCACLGGNAKMPLGGVSFSENPLMARMGAVMLVAG